MFLSENSTPEREEEIYKILLFCIECDIKSDEIKWDDITLTTE